jgi:hypothetical protein
VQVVDLGDMLWMSTYVSLSHTRICNVYREYNTDSMEKKIGTIIGASASTRCDLSFYWMPN